MSSKKASNEMTTWYIFTIQGGRRIKKIESFGCNDLDTAIRSFLRDRDEQGKSAVSLLKVERVPYAATRPGREIQSGEVETVWEA